MGIMEVRTVLVTLLSQFWVDLAPSMGSAEEVHQLKQQVGLTLFFFFFFGIYKTKRYRDTLGVHSWEPPGTSRYAQHHR
jgi:hypothetical protein